MKKFNQFNEMSMSVTLKPKKNNMYKVTGVCKKMAAHGGIKKGEKFHDRDIDGMHDSGIKVKYEKPKMKKVNERNTGVKEMPPIKMKIKPLKFKPIPGNPKYKGPANPKPPVMLNVRQKDGTMKKVAKEAIERRMDRKTIIATDPATGRRIVKIAPKKEIKIGKGKMESYVAEISDTMKVNYIKKAGKDVSYLEKQKMKPADKQVNNVRMDRDSAPFYKDVNKKNIDKEITKRRKGMRMATGKLKPIPSHLSSGSPKNEENLQELETKTLANYQKKAGAQYKMAKRDSDERTAYKPFSVKGGQAMDKADALRKKRGKGLGMSKKILDKRYSDKQVKMGKGIAFDKRYKGRNMTGASKAIDKIKKGLSDHPKVSGALKRANEEFNKGE